MRKKGGNFCFCNTRFHNFSTISMVVAERVSEGERERERERERGEERAFSLTCKLNNFQASGCKCKEQCSNKVSWLIGVSNVSAIESAGKGLRESLSPCRHSPWQCYYLSLACQRLSPSAHHWLSYFTHTGNWLYFIGWALCSYPLYLPEILWLIPMKIVVR